MAGTQILLGGSRPVSTPKVHSHKPSFTPVTLRHQRIHHAPIRSPRPRKVTARQRQLNILAASSVDEDVRRPSDSIRSAQDLAEGVQSFLDDAQKQLSQDETPLPEHPVGEPGTINIAHEIDATVSN